MNPQVPKPSPPEILAPAGSKDAFLAALAAGADAVYCGLKQFSARMEAKNFQPDLLASLVALAHQKGARVYVTFNTLVKPAELEAAAAIFNDLTHRVKPDGVIVQDPGVLEIIRQTGFGGEVHLSTLANVTFPAALSLVRERLGVDRVVVPRELNVDEIKGMAAACPAGLSLEVFVHGALCYGVSGRCYWSSYMGGKSGLRGRCVQPCRRLYALGGEPGKRYFSCRDLSLDVLVKVLKGIPEIAAWKIEGRKKGPHYVYYTTRAYRLLRDQGSDPEMKRTALQLLERALGRDGTHYHFLPQRPQQPVDVHRQTGSGFLMGTVKGSRHGPSLSPREALLPGDVLRVGYEDDRFHAVYRIRKHVPKKGRFHLKTIAGSAPPKEAPVFLTDRREKALADMIRSLSDELNPIPPASAAHLPSALLKLPKRPRRGRPVSMEMDVLRHAPRKKPTAPVGVWLSEAGLAGVTAGAVSRLWWWLPPVVWPENADALSRRVARVKKMGARRFFLNSPWQMGLFSGRDRLTLWAGPFCNLANPLALKAAAALGFAGAVVTPELGAEDYLALPASSPLPLGVVIGGNWPLCISRIRSDAVPLETPFASPRGEQAWAVRHEADDWLFPNWELDLSPQRKKLKQAGYSLFVRIEEPKPPGVGLKNRPGVWNWDVKLA